MTHGIGMATVVDAGEGTSVFVAASVREKTRYFGMMQANPQIPEAFRKVVGLRANPNEAPAEWRIRSEEGAR